MTNTIGFVNLRSVPFTVIHSRFLLRYQRDGSVGLFYVRYEVPLEDCLVTSLPAPRNDADLQIAWGHVSTGAWSLALKGNEARLTGPATEGLNISSDYVELHPTEDGMALVGDLTVASTAPTDLFTEEADEVVEAWMDRAPVVNENRQAMVDQSWWVLGANQVLLKLADGKEVSAVVPSKVGYVGLWQWDAYFIALGLRHGAPALAAEQIDIAFTPAPNGQLPDVVHEQGILSSSEDLPASDIETLRRKSGTDTDEVVPLTKPPLGAWAATRVMDALDSELKAKYAGRWSDILFANQDWWLRHGLNEPPRYEHPYSSGLDDSPVFDAGGAVVSPDLLAYLIRQQQILDGWDDAPVSEERILFLRRTLDELWSEDAQTYLPQHLGGNWIESRTVLSLLALFAGDIPKDKLLAVAQDIDNPDSFGAPYPIPTVAMNDPKYAADEMWRGPTWVNTTYLIAEGLERNGLADQADSVRKRLLDGIQAAKGPVEYFNSKTGVKAPGATVSFGWSAALYVDLAVREATH